MTGKTFRDIHLAYYNISCDLGHNFFPEHVVRIKKIYWKS